jgi:hypothetical protein
MFKITCLLGLFATIGLLMSLPAQTRQVEVNQQSGTQSAPAVVQGNADQDLDQSSDQDGSRSSGYGGWRPIP